MAGRRATPLIHALWRELGGSSATTWGRSRRSARRTSSANSRRPGTTGKYVNRPRRRLPASGVGVTFSSDIAPRLFSQHLGKREFERSRFVGAFCRETLQLDSEPRHVDA